jgi:hypothetical protein
MRSRSNSPELMAKLRFDRSLKRFFPRPRERRRRDARRLSSAETRSRARFWRSAHAICQRDAMEGGYSFSLAFLAKVAHRIRSAREVGAFAGRAERLAEVIETTADGISFDDRRRG